MSAPGVDAMTCQAKVHCGVRTRRKIRLPSESATRMASLLPNAAVIFTPHAGTFGSGGTSLTWPVEVTPTSTSRAKGLQRSVGLHQRWRTAGSETGQCGPPRARRVVRAWRCSARPRSRQRSAVETKTPRPLRSAAFPNSRYAYRPFASHGFSRAARGWSRCPCRRRCTGWPARSACCCGAAPWPRSAPGEHRSRPAGGRWRSSRR